MIAQPQTLLAKTVTLIPNQWPTGGDLADSLFEPAGRFSYIASASKLASKVPANAAAAIALPAERNSLKRYYRGRLVEYFLKL
jgi:hypothetical protein